jgi:hypothetical protein
MPDNETGSEMKISGYFNSHNYINENEKRECAQCDLRKDRRV